MENLAQVYTVTKNVALFSIIHMFDLFSYTFVGGYEISI